MWRSDESVRSLNALHEMSDRGHGEATYDTREEA